MRRPKHACAGCLSAAIIAAVAHQQAMALTSPIGKGSLTIKLSTIATIAGTDGTPQDLAFPTDATGRIFIATRNGDIRILTGGSLLSTPFLDESTAGVTVYTGGEGGLLGLAFSPNYVTDRTFYTLQTEPFSTTPAADYSEPELRPTTTTNPNNQVILRKWTASAGNANVANTTSTVLLRINHPQSNHQGGSLRFGPDGNLYLGLGDGGGGNDFNGSATSTTDGHNNTIGNGQDTTVPLGKVLRINPNPAAGAGFTVSTNGQYAIPNSNPFISGSGGNLKEIYAYGLRNPFRLNFDSTTGTLYAADVGQSNREEIDQITNGGNYGWVFREGTRDNSGDAGRTTPGGFTSIDPIAEYTHSDGIATIGGEVFRGSGFSSLAGKYVFGDLGGPGGAIGRMFYTDAAGGTISEFNYDSTGLTPASNLYGVIAGPNGELYALFSNNTIEAITAGVFSTRWNISTGGSWTTAVNWSNGLPTPQASHANFLASPGLTAPANITLDGNRTVGQITFDNINAYTLTQGTGGILTIDDSNDAGGVNPSITVNTGGHTISAPVTLATNLAVSTAGSTALTISGALTAPANAMINKTGGGTFTLSGAITAGSGVTLDASAGATNVSTDPTATMSFIVSGSGIVNFTAATSGGIQLRHAGGVTINSSGQVKLLSPAAHANRTLLVTGGVTIPLITPASGSTPAVWAGTLDIGGNDMIVHNGSLATLVSQARSAFLGAGSAWSGTGLTSSAAAGDANHVIAIGIIQNANVAGGPLYGIGTNRGPFDGQDAVTTDVLVKETFFGDTDLSGSVNAADYTQIDNGYAMHSSGWFNGDFNYDNLVNATDYSLIDAAFSLQSGSGAPLGSAPLAVPLALPATTGTTAVPEPANVGLLLSVASGLFIRRRRSR